MAAGCSLNQDIQLPLNGKLFRRLYTLILTRVGLWKYDTVMQTRDTVKGLHNFREFEKVPFCFHKIFLKNTREFKTSQLYLLTLI